MWFCFVSRWGRGPRSGYHSGIHPIITDYRTGYIRSHLRSPSGRVRWLSPCLKHFLPILTYNIFQLSNRNQHSVNNIKIHWQQPSLWPMMSLLQHRHGVIDEIRYLKKVYWTPAIILSENFRGAQVNKNRNFILHSKSNIVHPLLET